jgi:hypothetical protein
MEEGRWKMGDEPIIINSGYRSPQVNAAVGGVPSSNHLTGCAVDIYVQGMEQLLRYAVILLDIADESKEAFDELLIEKNARGAIWLHFAVRPKDNKNEDKTDSDVNLISLSAVDVLHKGMSAVFFVFWELIVTCF